MPSCDIKIYCGRVYYLARARAMARVALAQIEFAQKFCLCYTNILAFPP